MRTVVNFFRIPFCLGLLAIVSLVGCGAAADPLGRQDISGEITLKGEPLDGGSIIFEPEDSSISTSGGASIAEGKFELPKGRGLAPGVYKIRISAAGGDVVVTEDAPGEPIESTERVPKNWNSQSDQTVTVEEGKPNHFEFEIP
ncbi:MAG: carboxypeptidase-like regulatory domain-containing protein [Pirellulaceae bacterium]